MNKFIVACTDKKSREERDISCELFSVEWMRMNYTIKCNRKERKIEVHMNLW